MAFDSEKAQIEWKKRGKFNFIKLVSELLIASKYYRYEIAKKKL
jgi:hypothetical protein